VLAAARLARNGFGLAGLHRLGVQQAVVPIDGFEASPGNEGSNGSGGRQWFR
jgi:hypothetical protein